jgi:capsular exopolysaccharide synthesis family protein
MVKMTFSEMPHDIKRSTAENDEAINVGAILNVIWRGKLIVLFSILVFAFSGIFYSFKVASPKYTSTAVVMLNNREEQVVDIGNVMSGLGSDITVINTELEVLKSRGLLSKVVDRLNLTQDPEFNSTLRTPSAIDTIKSQLKRFLGESPAPQDSREGIIRQATIDALFSSVRVRNVPQSLVFQISVETSDRNKSAEIADQLVDSYILNQIEAKFEATEQATAWLSGRVAELQASLEEAEGEVKDFRASTPLVSAEALRGLEIQVKETRGRIEGMKSAKSSMDEQLSKLQSASNYREVYEITNDLQLERLLPRIEDPTVLEAFKSRASQIEQRLKADIDRIDNQIEAVQRSLSELEGQAEKQSRDLITLEQLVREAEASRLLYEYFLSRLKETSAQQGIQQADSRVISSAVPPSVASSPQKTRIVALYSFFGLILGIGYVLVMEYRDDSFRSIEDLEKWTAYHAIGQIPKLKSKKRTVGIEYLKNHPASAVAEAVRNLRTSVMLFDGKSAPKVLMVCSSVPGEGKTTSALALSLSFASMGKRVLLIDGDIRRRALAEHFGKSKDADGIVSVLTGERSFDDVVFRDETTGADILLGDVSVSNAADVFSSTQFGDLIFSLRERYDVIIMDTAPVLVVPDARIIAQHVDSILFVVKWNQTQRSQVLNSLREFESAGKPVSGLILNQIDPRGMRRYGYGNLYGAYGAYGSTYYSN